LYGNTVIGTLAVVIFIFIGHTTARKNRKERKHIAFTQSLKKTMLSGSIAIVHVCVLSIEL